MANFKDVIESSEYVLVDFHATWCGPCQTLAPILQEVKKDVGDKLRIVKIDIDKNPQLATQMGVRGVPSLFFYKDGDFIKSTSGVLAKHEIKKIFGF
jgi:thioredoxin 1